LLRKYKKSNSYGFFQKAENKTRSIEKTIKAAARFTVLRRRKTPKTMLAKDNA